MNAYATIVRIILEHYPATQAIYLFGTYGTADEWPDSDVDIAVLLPPEEAKRADPMAISDARVAMERLLGKDIDLINLRRVSTVFQKEIIMAERRIFCADANVPISPCAVLGPAVRWSEVEPYPAAVPPTSPT